MVSRTRRLLDLETHARVFTWMLGVLAKHGLIDGKTIGVDGTTLEANAAMRSIVRRYTGESYTDFLTKLAKASGIETPTREDLAKLDRNRAKKGSNGKWIDPDDPDAKITKMKDGQTHLAHKAEHANRPYHLRESDGRRKSYNPKNKGKKSYQPMLTFVAETREYLGADCAREIGQLASRYRITWSRRREHYRRV